MELVKSHKLHPFIAFFFINAGLNLAFVSFVYFYDDGRSAHAANQFFRFLARESKPIKKKNFKIKTKTCSAGSRICFFPNQWKKVLLYVIKLKTRLTVYNLFSKRDHSNRIILVAYR